MAVAAATCALLFGALHAVWPLAYFYFPAFGRFTLGPSFDWAFGRPATRLFDLIVAALFVVAAALPLAAHRPWGTRVPRWVIVSGLWTAGTLLGLRGAAGGVQDLLSILGIIDVPLTRWVVYDAWFLLLGVLFVAAARDVPLAAPGRTGTPMTPVLSALFRALRAASPRLAARLADVLFCMPPRARASPVLAALLRTGRRFELVVDRRRVVAWRWGRGGPAVLLVHGWGSRGGRLGAYVAPLTAAGYSVVAFDAPGHGESAWGTSSIPEFARSVLALRQVAGPLHAVVAHSVGGAATMLAMRWGLETRRVALIAPPAHPLAWIDRFTEILRLDREVVALMREYMERRLRCSWTDLDFLSAARTMSVPVMVVHDRDDPTVPWQHGADLARAWPGAKLVITEGLGHRDILRDPAIVRAVTTFVADEAPVEVAVPDHVH